MCQTWVEYEAQVPWALGPTTCLGKRTGNRDPGTWTDRTTQNLSMLDMVMNRLTKGCCSSASTNKCRMAKVWSMHPRPVLDRAYSSQVCFLRLLYNLETMVDAAKFVIIGNRLIFLDDTIIVQIPPKDEDNNRFHCSREKSFLCTSNLREQNFKFFDWSCSSIPKWNWRKVIGVLWSVKSLGLRDPILTANLLNSWVGIRFSVMLRLTHRFWIHG